MFDVVIVGGGLCGLALARHLQGWAGAVALYEARDRLGGRVLSMPSRDGAQRFDLGPSWYWPRWQPLITQLIEELELASFEQYDQGAVLSQRESGKAPTVAPSGSLHDGARRLVDGMASLTDRLARELPADTIQLAHTLTAVCDRVDHVELQFEREGKQQRVCARVVVLAIPPRLLSESVRFEPALDAPLRARMQGVPTRMAAQAKAVVCYEQAAWRSAGRSGSAFVQHEQAVLAETYDACDPRGAAALAGFSALSPARRREYHVGHPLLIKNQLSQLFGESLRERELLTQDWADEPFTCTAADEADLERELSQHEYGDAALLAPLWQQRLYLSGSETASHGGGYLEGALDAALRVAGELASISAARRASTRASDALAQVAQACTDVLTLTEGLAMEDFLRSRLTRPEVRRKTLHIASQLARLGSDERAALPELDWAAWDKLPGLIANGGALEEDALCVALETLIPVTLTWLRLHGGRPAPAAPAQASAR